MRSHTLLAPTAGQNAIPPASNDAAPGSRYLPRAEAAAYAGCSTRHLERLAQDGGGPPYLRHGRRTVYPFDALDRWLRAQLVNSTSGTGGVS